MGDPSELRLRVLGEVGATRRGAEVSLGGRRQRAVLAVLVLARGEVVSAERLVDCLWGEDAPANPAGVLQSYVSHLRRRLEPEAGARSRRSVIVSVGAGYALRLGADAVDCWRFEQAVRSATGLPPADAVPVLDEALHLWRGPAYVEYADEPWAEAEISRLTQSPTLEVKRVAKASSAPAGPTGRAGRRTDLVDRERELTVLTRAVDDLDGGSAAVLIEVSAGIGKTRLLVEAARLLFVEVRHLGGALSRPSPRGGALDRMDGEFLVLGVGVDDDPAAWPGLRVDAGRVLGAREPWGTGALYLSMVDSQSDARRGLPEASLRRLSTVRAAADPQGLFVVAHPASQ